MLGELIINFVSKKNLPFFPASAGVGGGCVGGGGWAVVFVGGGGGGGGRDFFVFSLVPVMFSW